MAEFPIYPSMISADFTRLGAQVAELEAAGAAALHFDVMDGQFVPNLTFGALVLKALRPRTRLPFHAHLMVFTPEELIQPLADAGANRLYLHPESTPHIHRWVNAVKDAGVEVGVSINPGTPIAMLEPLLPLLDAVLVMSVDPGFGGQAFQPSAIGRVAQTKELMARLGVSPDLECDGGVDTGTIRPLVEAGMTGAVVGSALFRDGDLVGTLRRLQQAAQG
ncbi:MAG TPA: ribulose-phosphate 3-epimerase [Armatimonadota bacterium]|jgi:ribulose-phosphate 3-epimerase